MISTSTFCYILVLKILMAVFCTYFLSGYIRLGDSSDYLESLYLSRNDIASPAYFLSYVAHVFLNRELILNVGAAILSFTGVYLALRPVKIKKTHRVILLFILVTPSFTLWSSIYSKESVIVFLSGIMIYCFSVIERKEAKTKLAIIVAFVALLLLIYFKRYYAPLYVFCFVLSIAILIERHIWLRQGLLPLVIIGGFLLLIFNWYDIGAFIIKEIPPHFSVEGSKSRLLIDWNSPESFWLNFFKNPLRGFMGPIFNEIEGVGFYLLVYVESCFLLFSMLYLIIVFSISYGSAFKIISVIFIILLGLLLQYVFGYINAGTGIRYRTDILLFLSVYVMWFLKVRRVCQK